MRIRPAKIAEQPLLEALQRRASLANPGDRAALLARPQAIVLPIEQIEAGEVFVAEDGSTVSGFASVIRHETGDAELDALFVEPESWGRGIGRALVEFCCVFARTKGAGTLHVIGNPHAERFYLDCGFELHGVKPMEFGMGLVMSVALD